MQRTEKGDGAFRSLQNRGFRRYFGGQMASMCGTWAQTVAMAWLILRLTGKATSVGLLTATQFVPVVLLSAWAGAVADRTDARRAVLCVQTLLGLQAATLATLVITDTVRTWMLYPLALVQGVGVAFDPATRQSFVGQLVGNADLRNALSLNAALVQTGRVVGPAAAGILIDTVGIGACFAVNAVSYVVVFLAVASIAIEPRPPSAVTRAAVSMFGDVSEGLRLVWKTRDLRNLLVLALVNGLASTNATVALPLLVREHYHNNARTYGVLAALSGLGALAGAFRAASRAPTKRLLVTVCALLGFALLLCSEQRHLALLAPGLLLIGFAGLSLGVNLNASLQLGAPEHMRGRIIGLYFTVSFGSNVVGGPLGGWIAQTWSAGASYLVSSIVAGVAAVWLLARWRDRLSESPTTPAAHAAGAVAPSVSASAGTATAGAGVITS